MAILSGESVSLRVVKMLLMSLEWDFNDWEEVDLYALFSIICMDCLHPPIPVGVWEIMILGLIQTAAQSLSPGVRSVWS